MTLKDAALARISQLSSQLAPAAPRPEARFRPALPRGLAPNHSPLNPLYFLLKAASIRPHHVALKHPERRREWTYEQWATRVAQLAHALRARGIERGDRVLVLAPNTPMIADALQAVPALQAIVVPVNTRMTRADVEYIADKAGVRFVLVDSELEHLVSFLKLPRVVCSDREGDEYERFLAEQPGTWHDLELAGDENDTMSISFTSGTTSRPKGVESSLRGVYLAAIANNVETKMDDKAVYLWLLPMFHILGWTFPYSCTMAMCTQICLRGVGTYDVVWDYLLNHGVTHYSGAPTVQLSITSHRLARRLDRTVTTTVAGAAPTPALIKALEGINIAVTHVYGLTETYGPTTKTYYVDETSTDVYKLKARQGASFLTADDIMIVKPGTVQEVAWDGKEVGEICMRGNIVMKGYYRDRAATREAFSGGWFHSGDLAVRFADGTFAIQDRAKDIIISGGENVSSLYVESELAAHPAVVEAAVVARPHDKYGERPHAFVVLRERVAVDELRQFARSRMPGFAVPEWFEVVEALEKTSTGKVSKKSLRERVKKL